MATTVKIGSFIYRINPSNPNELQRGTDGRNWSFVGSINNGAKILDLSASGEDLIMSTTSGTYVRNHHGGINPQK